MSRLRALCLVGFMLVVMVVGFAIPAQAATNYTTITLKLKSANDNCLAWYNGSKWGFLTGDKLNAVQAGYHSAAYHRMQSGFRYIDVPIDRGSDIRSAYLTFTAYDKINTGRVVASVIRYEDDFNDGQFSTYDNFVGRDRSSSVEWNDIPAWTAGKAYKSPDISTLVQDIVDDGDWDYGGNIVLFWGDEDGDSTTNNGVCRRAFSASSSKSVTLTIVYDAGTSSTTSSTSTSVANALNSIDSRLNNLANTDMAITSDLSTLKSQMSAMVAEVQALRSQAGSGSQLSGNMDTLISTLSSVANQQEQLQKEFAAYQNSMGELKTMVQTTANKVGKVQVGTDNITKMVGSYSGGTDALDKSMGMVKTLVILCLLLVAANMAVLYLIYKRGK